MLSLNIPIKHNNARMRPLELLRKKGKIKEDKSGHRPVLDVEVVALAKALNVSVAWLFGEIEA